MRPIWHDGLAASPFVRASINSLFLCSLAGCHRLYNDLKSHKGQCTYDRLCDVNPSYSNDTIHCRLKSFFITATSQSLRQIHEPTSHDGTEAAVSRPFTELNQAYLRRLCGTARTVRARWKHYRVDRSTMSSPLIYRRRLT